MPGFSAALICCCITQSIAIARDKSGDTSPQLNTRQPPADGLDAGSESVLVPAPFSSSLKGGVRGAALLTEDGLKKLGETSKELDHATLLIMGEVTRKEMVQVRGPNVLPNGIVIQPVPSPSGMAAAGPLPPRKRQLRLFMREITYQAQLLRNEVNALIIPDDKQSLISEPWAQIRDAMFRIESHLARLQMLTSGTKFESLEIGREAVAIHDLADAVDRLRKRVAAILKQ